MSPSRLFSAWKKSRARRFVLGASASVSQDQPACMADTPNGILAAFPSEVIILRKPTALMGAPRSLINSAWGLLALKPAQRAKFAAGQCMNRGDAVLEPSDVQPGMDEINLVPAQGRQLGRS